MTREAAEYEDARIALQDAVLNWRRLGAWQGECIEEIEQVFENWPDEELGLPQRVVK